MMIGLEQSFQNRTSRRNDKSARGDETALYENSEIRKKVVTGVLGQCGAAKECGPRTPPQEKQQPHGVEAILKNHERTERYTSMICALVKI